MCKAPGHPRPLRVGLPWGRCPPAFSGPREGPSGGTRAPTALTSRDASSQQLYTARGFIFPAPQLQNGSSETQTHNTSKRQGRDSPLPAAQVGSRCRHQAGQGRCGAYLRCATGPEPPYGRRRHATSAPRGPIYAAPSRAPSSPASEAPEPRGSAPAPEVVEGGAEHAGTLAGPRGSSRRRGIRPSRTRTFRSARPARCATPATANKQGEFACPAFTGQGNQSCCKIGRTRQVPKEARGAGCGKRLAVQ